jgi:hypothetical protein
MEKALTIILADGGELVFDAGTRVNFSREQLRVSIDTPKKAAGIHTDRFAAMVQVSASAADVPAGTEPKSVCTIELGVDRSSDTGEVGPEQIGTGETGRSIEVERFQTASVDAANNLMTFRGETAMVVVNLDYLKCYQIEKGVN